jgi:hypothetical protein
VQRDDLSTYLRSPVGRSPGATPPARVVQLLPLLIAVFRDLSTAGIPLVCSRDAGIGPLKPLDALPYGPAMMANLLGAPPVEALRAITSVAAQACRLGDQIGWGRGCAAGLSSVLGSWSVGGRGCVFVVLHVCSGSVRW